MSKKKYFLGFTFFYWTMAALIMIGLKSFKK